MTIENIYLQQIQQFAPNYYVAIRNPKWTNAEHSRIDCEVNFKHVGFEEWTPFTACPLDSAPYSKDIFDRCAAGEFGEVAEFVDPASTQIISSTTYRTVEQSQVFTSNGSPVSNIGEISVVSIL